MRNLPQKVSTACIILSGGWSSRMGSPKALLPYSDSRNFLQQLISQYKQAGVPQVIVVKNPTLQAGLPDHETGIRYVTNPNPDAGRLQSLRLGMDCVPEADFCYIQNIDNPFADVSLITNLFDHRNEADFVTPVWEGRGGHPVLVSGKVANAIRASTGSAATLRDVLQPFERCKVPAPDGKCLININEPADYARYFPHLKTAES